MTKLQQRREQYERRLDAADKAREAFRAEVRVQRGKGRTLNSIAVELGLSKSRVLRIEQGKGGGRK